MTDSSLRERKQQRAREQIIDAAYQLFAEHGFAAVTVADIAERAEVGRTTFFRHFGDKQEVVFADEQGFLDGLAQRQHDGERPGDLRAALRQLRPLAVAICAQITARDPRRYTQRERLIELNPELHDRNARKLRRMAEAAEQLLRARGADAELAALAAEVALACVRAGRHSAGTDPDALVPAVGRAFDRLDRLGA